VALICRIEVNLTPELTAAGLFGIYTRFPFNRTFQTDNARTKSSAKVALALLISNSEIRADSKT
jgi:hypothetical protein